MSSLSDDDLKRISNKGMNNFVNFEDKRHILCVISKSNVVHKISTTLIEKQHFNIFNNKKKSYHEF